jgi:hypothetical protein
LVSFRIPVAPSSSLPKQRTGKNRVSPLRSRTARRKSAYCVLLSLAYLSSASWVALPIRETAILW